MSLIWELMWACKAAILKVEHGKIVIFSKVLVSFIDLAVTVFIKCLFLFFLFFSFFYCFACTVKLF